MVCISTPDIHPQAWLILKNLRPFYSPTGRTWLAGPDGNDLRDALIASTPTRCDCAEAESNDSMAVGTTSVLQQSKEKQICIPTTPLKPILMMGFNATTVGILLSMNGKPVSEMMSLRWENNAPWR